MFADVTGPARSTPPTAAKNPLRMVATRGAIFASCAACDMLPSLVPDTRLWLLGTASQGDPPRMHPIVGIPACARLVVKEQLRHDTPARYAAAVLGGAGAVP